MPTKPSNKVLENRINWVAALRSGKYKQGSGSLTQITKNGQLDCCLGVACKVLGGQNQFGSYRFSPYLL